MAVVDALFGIPPLFDAASRSARRKIIDRANSIGVNWDASISSYDSLDWEAALARVTDPSIELPAYYTLPFHAYKEGNLCIAAAVEAASAAKSVHAPVMDPDNKALDPQGDENLRRSYHARLLEMRERLGAVDAPSTIVDIGCATGLSSRALLDAFPGAAVCGVDLSPHFLVVAEHDQGRREDAAGAAESLSFVHAAGEAVPMESGSVDLVSVCLVMHELPAAATDAVIAEAHRLLRPGGCLAVMEMDPTAPSWLRVFDNPFAFTAFKSTEPWLQEFITVHLQERMAAAGFADADSVPNTPRHRTTVAVKR